MVEGGWVVRFDTEQWPQRRCAVAGRSAPFRPALGRSPSSSSRPPKAMRAVTAREMAALDRRATARFGIPSLLLMENAGRAVADVVWARRPRRVLVVCGGGNNGGDGFVAARHLALRGARCTVVVARPPGTPDAAQNLAILRRLAVPVAAWGRLSAARWRGLLRGADVVVDALVGTGLTSALRAPYPALIEGINQAGKPVVSVDLPSGLHADTGRPLGVCVRATRTVTLGLPKRGFRRPGARAYTGAVLVADISLPTQPTRENRIRFQEGGP